MKNKEFYRDEIFEIACNGQAVAVCDGKPVVCGDTQCSQCDFRGTDCTKLLKEWLEKEHEESTEWKIQPEVKNLKQDDRVLVSTNGENWVKRHFKMYDQKNDTVHAYECGATSWTVYDDGAVEWACAKLPEDEKQEIDWTKVPVDTKIWVKNSHDPIWIPRHFAEYKHEKVHAWLRGKTSFTTSEEQSWDCAKLAEEKE